MIFYQNLYCVNNNNFSDCNQVCAGKQAINKYTDGQNFDTSHREIKYMHSIAFM